MYGSSRADFLQGNGGNDGMWGYGGNDRLDGGDGTDRLYAGDGDDRLSGGAGDDVLDGGAGDDVIVGGDGVDTALYSGKSSDYRISLDGDEVVVEALDGRPEGVDRLTGVEKLKFSDGVLTAPAIAVNTAPSASNDAASTPIDQAVVIDVLGNDGDPDGDQLAIVSVGAAQHGVAVAQNGRIVYTPAAGYVGIDAFTYQASDGRGGFSTAMVSVTVEPAVASDEPVAYDGKIVVGTDKSQNMYGSSRADSLEGNGGNDRLWGYGGNDKLDGGEGADKLYAGDGDDTLQGGSRDDLLHGDDGADLLDGGDGDDRLYGGAGDDVLTASAGTDVYYGEAGYDLLLGGSSDDLISFASFGSANGVEKIDLGLGANRLLGTSAADTLDFSQTTLAGVAQIDAGAGDDEVTGSAGDDVFVAGSGDDLFDGGLGEDVLVLAGRRADYQIAGQAAAALQIEDLNLSDGDEGTDAVANVERFRFADGEASLAELVSTVTPPPPPPPAEAETPYYVDALQTGYSWGSGPLTLGYTFLTAVPDYYSSSAQERNGFSSFNTAQKAAAEYALEQISAVCNVTFVESPLSEAQLTFGNAVLSPSYGAFAYYPSFASIGGDVWINSYYSQNLSPAPGNYGGMTLLHEIGHAMGLKHTFDANLGPALPEAEDSRKFTVMSYDAHAGTAGEPRSMMLYDIAALQDLYGANASWRSGDDVYALAGKRNYISTIWDGGGRDVLDASLETSRVILDLREGHFSSVGESGTGLARDNVGIAFGAKIEDAMGGAGADTLIGNEMANFLGGGGGDDVLTGGLGDDLFTFDAGWGRDVVTDFEDGLDRLQFHGHSVESLTIQQADEGALVGDGVNWVQLTGLSVSLLNQDDFLFA